VLQSQQHQATSTTEGTFSTGVEKPETRKEEEMSNQMNLPGKTGFRHRLFVPNFGAGSAGRHFIPGGRDTGPMLIRPSSQPQCPVGVAQSVPTMVWSCAIRSWGPKGLQCCYLCDTGRSVGACGRHRLHVSWREERFGCLC
jgi:hypothetical protein